MNFHLSDKTLSPLKVDLGHRSYNIRIEKGLFNQKGDWLTEHCQGQQCIIISNETVAPLYLESVRAQLAHKTVHSIILPDGEQYKQQQTLELIYNGLMQQKADRQTTLLALGGGVIGDMTGFAAATFMRGIPFIQIPTTLLAMVDSSVGGKTGINHPLGKNMIGAFHQPQAVFIDMNTLSTLPERELSAGLAEIVKYGLINDAPFLHWLDQNADALLAKAPQVMNQAIYHSCQCKADLVAADEREAGQRALLNLGHTFGHAIEAGMGYGHYLHGEAVAIGMVMAAQLSVRLGWINPDDLQFITQLLKKFRLPTEPPQQMNADDFLRYMTQDKKAMNGQIRLILLKELGQSVIHENISQPTLKAAIEAMIQKHAC